MLAPVSMIGIARTTKISEGVQAMRPSVELDDPVDQALVRVRDVLRLRAGVFAEVAADTSATKQCLAIFSITSAVGGIWSLAWMPLLIVANVAVLGLEAVILRFVARLFSKSVAGFAAWLRALLLASAPGAFAAIPQIGLLVAVGYATVTTVLVVRELAQITTGRAVAVLLICVAAPVLVLGLLAVALAFSFISALLT